MKNIKDLKLGATYKGKNGVDFGARKVRISNFTNVPNVPITELEFTYTGKSKSGLRFVTNALEIKYLSRSDIKNLEFLRDAD